MTRHNYIGFVRYVKKIKIRVNAETMNEARFKASKGDFEQMGSKPHRHIPIDSSFYIEGYERRKQRRMRRPSRAYDPDEFNDDYHHDYDNIDKEQLGDYDLSQYEDEE